MEQNHIENILVIRHAISDKRGVDVKLGISVKNRGGASVTRLAQATSAVSVTIDQIYEMYPQRLMNTLIWKMDIECYEGFAFAGASKFLEEVRPCWIMIELKIDCLNGRGPLKYKEIISLLKNLGYRLDTPVHGEDHLFRHDDCCMQHESCIFK